MSAVDQLGAEHRQALGQAITFAQCLELHRPALERFLDALDHAHNVGWFTNPTLYQQFLAHRDQVAVQERIAKAAIAFMDAIKAEKAAVAEVEA